VLHAESRMEAVPASISDHDTVGTLIILAPLEPTEGRDRLVHMLPNAQPSLVLIAADFVRQRLQDNIIYRFLYNHNRNHHDHVTILRMTGTSRKSFSPRSLVSVPGCIDIAQQHDTI